MSLESVVFDGKEYHFEVTNTDGSCLFHSLRIGLAQHFNGVDSSISGCRQLRAEICDWMSANLDDVILQETLWQHRLDRRAFRHDWTMRRNVEAEIDHLQHPTAWGGFECVVGFCKLYCVRVRIILDNCSHQIGTEGEEIVIHYNGVNHYRGLKILSRAERQAMSRKRTKQAEEPEAIRARVERHRRKRKAEKSAQQAKKRQ